MHCPDAEHSKLFRVKIIHRQAAVAREQALKVRSADRVLLQLKHIICSILERGFPIKDFGNDDIFICICP